MRNIFSAALLICALIHFNANPSMLSASEGDLVVKNEIAIDLSLDIENSLEELAGKFRYIVAFNPNESDMPPSLMRLGNTNSEILFCDKCPSNTRSIKTQEGHPQTVPFKQFIFDYIYQNPILENVPIKLINCNMYGAEEKILEELLYFCYNNQCDLKISFDYSAWTHQNIEDYSYFFSFFDTTPENVTEWIQQNPSASLLFKPKQSGEQMIKKNITALIIGYNLVTFIKHMVEQLEPYTSDIVIVDNNSSFPPLLDYYKNEYAFTLLRQKQNYGHWVYGRKEIEKLVGEVFILTDPDIYFQESMPDSLIQDMLKISSYYNSRKVGVALCIDREDIRDDVFFCGETIKKWELKFWLKEASPALDPYSELYEADIDTTFCLINRRNSGACIRMAGPYTSLHIPWLKGFKKMLLPQEIESYVNSPSTTWIRSAD